MKIPLFIVFRYEIDDNPKDGQQYQVFHILFSFQLQIYYFPV